MRKILCFAEGSGQSYEAICVDLDIAVQGRSMKEAVTLLNKAVATYIEDALKEDAATSQRLLSRRAPWHVRVGYKLRFMARGWLDWSQADLAERAKVSLSTIRDFEKGRRVPIANNLDAIHRAFEASGVAFEDVGGVATGISVNKIG